MRSRTLHQGGYGNTVPNSDPTQYGWTKNGRRMNGQMNEWMDVEGWKDGRIEGWVNGRMEGWKDGRMEGWKDGRIEGWVDGKMDGWMDG